MAVKSSRQYAATPPAILGLARVLLLAIAQLPFARTAPIHPSLLFSASPQDEGRPPDDPSLWLYLGVAAFLVLLGGAFAGLTIALMGQVCQTIQHWSWDIVANERQDEMYLQVIKESGEGAEKKHATKVLK